jgi:replication factor A1
MSTESNSTAGDAQSQNTSSSLVAANAINSGGRWIDLEAKVLGLWKPHTESVAQVGLLGDSTGVVKFVSWAKSDLPELEEGKAYSLEMVVTDEHEGQNSVNLNSETSIEEITGPKATRERLAADVATAVALETIDSEGQWIDVLVTVDQLWEPYSESMAQVGLVADSTSRMKFVAFETSELPKLEEGASYRLSNVVTDEYEGDYSIKLNSQTEIERLD